MLQQLTTDNYNQSTDNHTHGLRTILKREGPILAAVFNVYAPTTQLERLIDGTHSSFVRCYDGIVSSAAMSLSPPGDGLRCIGQHVASNADTRSPPDTGFARSFSIKTNDSAEVDVNVYFADVEIYVSTETFGSSKCLIETDKCTWQDFISIQAPFPFQEIFSKNILVVELTLGNHTIIYEFITFESFATYSFDISVISNPLRLIQIDGLPIINDLEPLAVHPDWFLAA